MIIRKWLCRSNLYETLQQHDVFWEKSIQFYVINDFETSRNQTNTQRLKNQPKWNISVGITETVSVKFPFRDRKSVV